MRVTVCTNDLCLPDAAFLGAITPECHIASHTTSSQLHYTRTKLTSPCTNLVIGSQTGSRK